MKNTYYLILQLVLFFFISACTDIKTDGTKKFNFENSSVLKGHEIKLNTGKNYLTDPVELFLLDSLIVLKNGKSSPYHFTIIDPDRNQLLRHFGIKGNGPGEFTSVFHPTHGRKRNTIEFYNSQKGYVRIYLDTVLANKNNYYEFLVKFRNNENNTVRREVPIYVHNFNDTVFILRGFFSGNFYNLYQKESKELKGFFSYPDDDQNEYNPEMKALVFGGLIKVHPSNNIFILAGLQSDWIEICSIDDLRIEKRHSKFSYLPLYSKNGNYLNIDFDSKVGNFELKVTQEYIYVLYSNETLNEILENFSINKESNLIRVYSWDGNLVRQLVLDRKIRTFDVDPSDRYIFAISIEPYPLLIKYLLDL